MFFFKRKKQNDHYFLYTLFGVIILSLILGMFIGIKLDKSKRLAKSKVQKALQGENLPKQVASRIAPADFKDGKLMIARVQPSCNNCTDVRVNTASSVTFDALTNTYSYVAILENAGTSNVTNLSWQIKNYSTNQVIKTGQNITLESGADYRIQTGQNNPPVQANPRLHQGDHIVKIEILSYTTTGPTETNTSNNVYTVTPAIHIATIDLKPISYEASYYTRYNENGSLNVYAYHRLKVKNYGDASSGTFQSKIEVNGNQNADAVINFPSIQGGSENTPDRVQGHDILSQGYNFVRAIVDSNGQVKEINESKNPPEQETNNIFNGFIFATDDTVESEGPYTESSTWFVKTPYIESNSDLITIPYINISSQQQNMGLSFSLYSNQNCSGNPISLTNVPTGPINLPANSTGQYVISLTSSEMQTLNNKTACIKTTDGSNLTRTFFAGFSDLTITNYQAGIKSVSYQKYNNIGTTLTYSTKGLIHTITVKNNGSANTNRTATLDVYVNGIKDGNTATINSLIPGATQIITIQPTNRALRGEWNIVKIAIDNNNSVKEMNETNNISYKEVKITDTNQLQTNGSPRIYNESKTYFMYRPKVQHQQGGKIYYLVPMTVIDNYPENNPPSPLDMKFKISYDSTLIDPSPIINNENYPSKADWPNGEFQILTSGSFNNNACLKTIEFFTKDENNSQYPNNAQSLFKKEDIGASCL